MRERILEIINNILNRILVYKYRFKIKNKDFTIISQNCAGGIIYHKLGMRMDSPTINTVLEGENFVKFVENFEYYITLEPVKAKDSYVDVANNVVCHYFSLGDITIKCFHEKTYEIAIEKWKRRIERVHQDNIFVIANTWDLQGKKELVDRICNCKYPSVVLSYGESYNQDNCIRFIGDEYYLDNNGVLKPDIFHVGSKSCLSPFEKRFDFVSFLNGEKNIL